MEANNDRVYLEIVWKYRGVVDQWELLKGAQPKYQNVKF